MLSVVVIDAVTVPVVVADNKFASSTLIDPLSTVRFWLVIEILPNSSFARSVENSTSDPPLIVEPEVIEKTVVI